MATRRTRNITSSNYGHALKLGADNRVVSNRTSSYSKLMYRQNRVAPKYSVNAWAKFDTTDFDGIQLVAFLMKNEAEIIHGANCTFNVYAVDIANWNETFIVQKTGVLASDGKFSADVTQIELNPTELDGEITLSIEVEIFRFNKSYKIKKYLNHLGVYDSIVRLRQDVDFLSITKKDE